MTKIMHSDDASLPHEVSAHEAVENSISDSIRDHAVTIAILVQLLVDAKVLTLEQIKPMLSSNYAVEE